jgi:hypothetical protein
MANNDPTSADNEPRVVNFRRRGGSGGAHPSVPSPVKDLAKYERDEGTNDYRHRMLTNAAALLFVVALIGAGLWLAETMAEMRKNQDCVLSGRRGCTPVEVNHSRW